MLEDFRANVLKTGPRNGEKMINSVKGLISQRRREKNDISFSFYIVYFGDSGLKKKTFTADFAQSGKNNADPFFIKSDKYIFLIFGLHLCSAL